jgi:cell division protein ZapA (FtsZ GTPase activity inhibitor)
MTGIGQEKEISILGCKVRYSPEQDDSHIAKAVIELVNKEIVSLKTARPQLRDTDVAVLIALKVAKDMVSLENEYKGNIAKLEESLNMAMNALGE